MCCSVQGHSPCGMKHTSVWSLQPEGNTQPKSSPLLVSDRPHLCQHQQMLRSVVPCSCYKTHQISCPCYVIRYTEYSRFPLNTLDMFSLTWVDFNFSYLLKLLEEELKITQSASCESMICVCSFIVQFLLLLSLGDPFTKMSVSPAPIRPFVPPRFTSFHFSKVEFVLCASLTATVTAVGPALPQFSIKTPNLNGAFKSRPVLVLPFPPIPPCSDLAFFLPFSLDRLTSPRKRSQL